jgi:hypothetical protein
LTEEEKSEALQARRSQLAIISFSCEGDELEGEKERRREGEKESRREVRTRGSCPKKINHGSRDIICRALRVQADLIDESGDVVRGVGGERRVSGRGRGRGRGRLE